MKVCSGCGVGKPRTPEFFYAHHTTRDGLRSKCKPCQVAASKRCWDALTPEVRTARNRRSNLKHVFAMTPARYDAILEAQGGGCAICGATQSGVVGRRMAVDHDHACCSGTRTCGKCVRGLLCRGCNTALGGFDDNPERLLSAVAYLRDKKYPGLPDVTPLGPK